MAGSFSFIFICFSRYFLFFSPSRSLSSSFQRALPFSSSLLSHSLSAVLFTRFGSTPPSVICVSLNRPFPSNTHLKFFIANHFFHSSNARKKWKVIVQYIFIVSDPHSNSQSLYHSKTFEQTVTDVICCLPAYEYSLWICEKHFRCVTK